MPNTISSVTTNAILNQAQSVFISSEVRDCTWTPGACENSPLPSVTYSNYQGFHMTRGTRKNNEIEEEFFSRGDADVE